MKFVFAVVTFFALSTQGFGISEKDQVINFYKLNVAGKTFRTVKPVTTKVYREKTAYILKFSRTIKFSQLTTTKNGLSFESEADIEYSLVRDAKVLAADEKPEVVKRKVTRHYELGERKSTDAVLGFIRIVKDSSEESDGEAYTLSAETIQDGLQLEETQIMYTDESLNDGTDLFPGATASTTTFSFDEKRRIVMDQAYMLYEVNATTFERVPMLKKAKGQPTEMEPVHVVSVQE